LQIELQSDCQVGVELSEIKDEDVGSFYKEIASC